MKSRREGQRQRREKRTKGVTNVILLKVLWILHAHVARRRSHLPKNLGHPAASPPGAVEGDGGVPSEDDTRHIRHDRDPGLEGAAHLERRVACEHQAVSSFWLVGGIEARNPDPDNVARAGDVQVLAVHFDGEHLGRKHRQ